MHEQDVALGAARDRFLDRPREQPLDEPVLAAPDDEEIGVALVRDVEQRLRRVADLGDVLRLEPPSGELRPRPLEPALRALLKRR